MCIGTLYMYNATLNELGTGDEALLKAQTMAFTIFAMFQLFNVFNNEAHDSWQTLILTPGDEYYPSAYVLPRRLGVRLGISF